VPIFDRYINLFNNNNLGKIKAGAREELMCQYSEHAI
jgi:hypothetical protein